MKLYTILPIVAIFLIAMSTGDKLWSLSYMLKVVPALIFIAISVVLLILDLRKKSQEK